MMAASILFKVTVILVTALAGARLARHSRAAVRHVLLAAAFVALLILPIASIVAPTVRVPVPAAVQQAMVPLAADPLQDAALPSEQTGGLSTAPIRSAWPSMFEWLALIWIGGAAMCLLPVVLGLRQVSSLRRSA